MAKYLIFLKEVDSILCTIDISKTKMSTQISCSVMTVEKEINFKKLSIC